MSEKEPYIEINFVGGGLWKASIHIPGEEFWHSGEGYRFSAGDELDSVTKRSADRVYRKARKILLGYLSFKVEQKREHRIIPLSEVLDDQEN